MAGFQLGSDCSISRACSRHATDTQVVLGVVVTKHGWFWLGITDNTSGACSRLATDNQVVSGVLMTKHG